MRDLDESGMADRGEFLVLWPPPKVHARLVAR